MLLEVQEGLRACEVSRLEVGDIDFGERTTEYPGGRYAVEYDNGVCKVQKP